MRPLLMLTSCTLPNETAIAAQQVKTAYALARAGLPVKLVAKKSRKDVSVDDVHEHYGLTPMPGFMLRLIHGGRGRHRNRMFFLRSLVSSELRGGRVGLFTAEPRGLPLSRLTRLKEPLIFEADEPANVPGRVLGWRSRVLQQRAIRSAKGIVTVTTSGASHFIEQGIDPERIVVIPNGADLGPPDPPREALEGRIRVLYVGSHWPDRGVTVLANAVPLMDERVDVRIVGESDPERLGRLRALVDGLGVGHRVSIDPAVPYSAVPGLLSRADIVVLPMMRSAVGERFASPMKLFEYMASERPLLASDLPTVREIVDENHAWFFRPEDPAALAASMTEIIKRWAEARGRAAAGRRLLESSYTWDARARALIEFMGRIGVLDGIPTSAGGPYA